MPPEAWNATYQLPPTFSQATVLPICVLKVALNAALKPASELGRSALTFELLMHVLVVGALVVETQALLTSTVTSARVPPEAVKVLPTANPEAVNLTVPMSDLQVVWNLGWTKLQAFDGVLLVRPSMNPAAAWAGEPCPVVGCEEDELQAAASIAIDPAATRVAADHDLADRVALRWRDPSALAGVPKAGAGAGCEWLLVMAGHPTGAPQHRSGTKGHECCQMPALRLAWIADQPTVSVPTMKVWIVQSYG